MDCIIYCLKACETIKASNFNKEMSEVLFKSNESTKTIRMMRETKSGFLGVLLLSHNL